MLALAAALASTTLAAATVFQTNGVRITVLSQIMPYKLPRIGTAPIAVFIAGHLENPEGGVPPQLQSMDVKVNRHGLLQSRGLPVCPPARLAATSSARALAACGPALIGSGQFWASIVFSGQPAYPTRGRLLIFNGRGGCARSSARAPSALNHPDATAQSFSSTFPSGLLRPSRSRTQGGRQGERARARDPQAADRGRRAATCRRSPELLAQIFTQNPFPTSFVITFTIRRIHQGPYGTELHASLPGALGSWGYLNRIKLTLRRKYHYHGHALSYFNAGCPAPKGARRSVFPLAYATFTFAGRQPIGAEVPKSCGVRE